MPEFVRDLLEADRRRLLAGLGLAVICASIAFSGLGLPELFDLFLRIVSGLASGGSVILTLDEVRKAKDRRLRLEQADAEDVVRLGEEARAVLPRYDTGAGEP